ncbi:hypothetical protein ABZ865_18470 [Streptomyces sp. NPDC047085]|uniref:hypothetical protein n=1 Tax=Streptomyces sp. NPDC047085 TaxID=3155140 RepID=UPI0033F40BB8
MEEHFGDAARAVRERQPGESAVDAVRRQFLEMVAGRDPSVGLTPGRSPVRCARSCRRHRVLMERAFLAAQKGTRELAELLAGDAGDRMLATVAAASLSAARDALIEEHHRRLAAGETPEQVAADAAERARAAFGLVENGLKDYAVRA